MRAGLCTLASAIKEQPRCRLFPCQRATQPALGAELERANLLSRASAGPGGPARVTLESRGGINPRRASLHRATIAG